MADIFISYSSKDKEHAERLTQQFASAGLSVWIDRSGIEVATSWSKEIVEAINGCKAVVLLLSSSSVISHNVIKEVSLASEKQKTIVPLDLEPVEIPPALEYQLAGIQRTDIANIDAIIRALAKIGLETMVTPMLRPAKDVDLRKKLMILPFEDLSPTRDNDWFADGLVSELINSLTSIRALRVVDAQTSREFKRYTGHLQTYAREMQIRYFVQGDVRKFGTQLKITSRLLDIETGDHLWQDSMKGTMEDIFDIQELVAARVLEGLSIIITQEEQRYLTTHGTMNAEAYEYALRASSYFERGTRADLEHALELYERATLLDGQYISALMGIANASQELIRQYGEGAASLSRANEAAEMIKRIQGESQYYYMIMSKLALRSKDPGRALAFAQRAVEIDPHYATGYESLGFIYATMGRHAEAAIVRKEYIRLREHSRNGYHNLLVSLQLSGNMSELQLTAARAVPIFERYIRLNPDDLTAQVSLAGILSNSGHSAEAIKLADQLKNAATLDAYHYYNLACLYLTSSLPDDGMMLLQKAVSGGYRNLDDLHHDPDLDSVRSTPAFTKLLAEVEHHNG